MNEIILSQKNNNVMASSVDVAFSFEKNHQHIMEAIRKLLESRCVESSTDLFQESTYKDAYGRKQKCYMMNRDGFSLLVMGFTGERALEWKLKYIAAFNQMEDKIRNGLPGAIDYKKLPSTNHAASILMRTYKQAGGNLVSLASTIAAMYRGIGVPVPALEDKVQKDEFFSDEIADMLGINSTSGIAHSKAVAGLIRSLGFGESDGVKRSYERNGHSGTAMKWYRHVADAVMEWVKSNGYPKVWNIGGTRYEVRYRGEL